MKPLRFVKDHDGGFTVLYREQQVGQVYPSLDYRADWYAEFFPCSGRYTVETSQRAARRWLREQAEDYDLETWYALQTGAKDL